MGKFILLTGSHRSGSTWTGKIISMHPSVKYVHEPYNIGLHEFNIPLKFWFEYISNDTEESKKYKIQEYIKSFYLLTPSVLVANILRTKSLKKAYKLIFDFFERTRSKNVIMKDPIAFFSAPWIYETFNSQTIMMIRHPAAFVASIKVKNWTFDFNELLLQEELMNKYLLEFKKSIEKYSKYPPDIIDQGILLWNIFHHTMLCYQKEYYGKWFFVKHEDLSLAPLQKFEEIFQYLGLNMTSEIKNEIIKSTTAQESDTLKRNAKENIKSWKKRLTAEEIDRIRDNTSEIWNQFYLESDW